MKQLLALFFLMVSVASLAAPIRVTAFSQCHSERKGYCIKLDPPDSGQNASQNSSSRFFALPFPGLEFLESYGVTLENEDVGTVISALYNFGVAIAAVSALIMFTYGGMRYLTSGDSSSGTSDARKYMKNAVLGLVLIVLSYLILYIINPDFTFKLKIPDLKDQISSPGSYAQSSYTGYSQSSYTGYSQSSYATYSQSSYTGYSQSSYATYSQASYAGALCTTTQDSCPSGFKCVGGHCISRD